MVTLKVHRTHRLHRFVHHKTPVLLSASQSQYKLKTQEAGCVAHHILRLETAEMQPCPHFVVTKQINSAAICNPFECHMDTAEA